MDDLLDDALRAAAERDADDAAVAHGLAAAGLGPAAPVDTDWPLAAVWADWGDNLSMD